MNKSAAPIAVVAAVIGLAASCTQDVVAVRGGSTDTTTTSVVSSSSGQGGGCAGTPGQVGALDCGGTAAVGVGGGPIQCVTFCTDQADNTWESDCDSNGCDCKFNDEVSCSCTFEPPASGCSGAGTCCPDPWPDA